MGCYVVKVLAADIGGTNTRVAICKLTAGRPEILEQDRFSTTKDTAAHVIAYGRDRGASAASIAAAGPPTAAGVTLTNAEVTMQRAELERAFAMVLLMNDLEAYGWATQILSDQDVHTIRKGEAKPGRRAILGAGTDLGKCIAVPDNDGIYRSVGGEGSTGNLPLLPEEHELGLFIMRERKAPYPMQGHILGGEGLELLHRFHGGSGTAAEIVAQRDATARTTVALFARLYARVARNLVLDVGAWNGCYLTGGIAQRNPTLFTSFVEEFTTAPRYAEILSRVPILIITAEEMSLLGAAYAIEHAR